MGWNSSTGLDVERYKYQVGPFLDDYLCIEHHILWDLEPTNYLLMKVVGCLLQYTLLQYFFLHPLAAIFAAYHHWLVSILFLGRYKLLILTQYNWCPTNRLMRGLSNTSGNYSSHSGHGNTQALTVLFISGHLYRSTTI